MATRKTGTREWSEHSVEFKKAWTDMAIDVNANAQRKGFWNGSQNQAEKICLMHSELSEALEAVRHGNPPSDHIPDFSGVEEELADCVIRVMDFAHQHNLRLADAILAKHAFNTTRPFLHGKQF